ncbi:MAG: 4'-phosphopantetheinyl transferase superfamily protein, partial [Acidobacteriota bacterium]
KSSRIRPFDRAADGILIGEGCGLVVLKRLADAERAGDRIYAVIRGTGVSSDGRESSAMRPRADGQVAAVAAAWRGLDPASVGLVEAHGTATPTGDEVELETLARVFGAASGPRAALGSVKSMIGHAMPAAGAAGLVKTALALHHGVLPPSLHCDDPHPALAPTRFRVLARAEEWPAEPAARRAGVSAFGFGGINAHVVLDAHASSPRRRPRRDDRDRLAIRGDSLDALRAALDAGADGGTGAMRLVVLDPTPERRALAHKVLERGKPWRGKSDIWFSPQPLAHAGGKLAFVFPGVEAVFAADVTELARELAVAVPPAIADAAAATSGSARDLERRGFGVFALGTLLHDALARAGVVPHAIAGHSLGEWTGMVASEMIPKAAADAFVAGLTAGSLEVPDVVFAAVGCGADGARGALDGLDAIAVSHDNCPHQSIVCGRRDRVKVALERLAARGVLCQELPFKSGFHSPLFADYLAPHRAHLARLQLAAPHVPLWSATTCAPYPADLAAIRALAIEHLVAPVRFRELVEALYADGVRAFVQLGVGSTIGFVGDTLGSREHLGIAACVAKQPAHVQLARVRAALWADGFAETAAPAARARAGMPLALGVPPVRLGDAVPPLSIASRPHAADDPLLAEMLATLDEIGAASRAVVDAYRSARRPRALTVRRALSVESDPALLDHCFYRQPERWRTVSDRYPVVPGTMTIAMMIDAARRLAPDRVALAVHDVRAYRWLAVAPPVELSIDARIRDDHPDQVEVTVGDYARGMVRFADEARGEHAVAMAPLRNPHPAPMTARAMYDNRWMFHGPAYQGVVELGPIGDDGVDGVIEVLPAPGALLDCAGQLMGWWVMQTETHDRLAMPMRIHRIVLHGPEPAVGTRVACRVRIREVTASEVTADLELSVDGRVYAAITGWTDRRFDSDEPVWAVLMYPEHNVLAEPRGEWVLVREHWRAAASRELMMRRYLGERERAAHDALAPRGRRGWLLGRIAVKDAVRLHHWQGGERPIFPVEIEVGNDAQGRPFVAGSELPISLAHKDDLAVAIVGAPGEAVGIDLERIEPRTDAFVQIAYTPAELALATDDEQRARLWAAKEAVAKALGTGITDPKRFEVRARPDGRLQIDAFVVDTRREGAYVVAWTRRAR